MVTEALVERNYERLSKAVLGGQRSVIATMQVVRPFQHTRTFETAAWYEVVEVQAGKPVALETDGERVYWPSLEGTVVAAHFPSLFGGVAVTDGTRAERIGKPERVGGMAQRIEDFAKVMNGVGVMWAYEGCVRVALQREFRVGVEEVLLPAFGSLRAKWVRRWYIERYTRLAEDPWVEDRW